MIAHVNTNILEQCNHNCLLKDLKNEEKEQGVEGVSTSC